MIHNRLVTLLAIFVLLYAGGSTAAGLPAISEATDNRQPGTFVWFDLITNDRNQVNAYYTKLFDWEISEVEGFPGYDLITNKGTAIGGVAEITDEEQPAWLGSVSVDDVEKSADRVTQLGGRILEPAQQVDDRGVMALVEDNTGSAFVLLDTGARDPVTRPVRTGDWLWTDLFTTDPTAAAQFYIGLAGFELSTFTDSRGNTIDVLVLDETARSGVVEIPWKHVTPAWLPYVRVENVAETVERSTQLGGQLFFQFEDGAVILDPTGAAFGVQQVYRKEVGG